MKDPVDIGPFGCNAQNYCCRQCLILHALKTDVGSTVTCPTCSGENLNIRRNDESKEAWKNTLLSLHFSEEKVDIFVKRTIDALPTSCPNRTNEGSNAETRHFTGAPRFFFLYNF